MGSPFSSIDPAHLMQTACANFSAGHHDAARAALASLPHGGEYLAEAWNLRAVMAVRERRFDEAATGFARAALLDPGKAEYHGNLASALWETGRHEEAVKSCRHALRLKPGLHGVLNTLGNALFTLGEHAEAEACFRQALQAEADNPLFHNNLGNVLKERGDVEGAIASYHRALQLKPDFVEAGTNLGIIRKEQGHIEAARAIFQQVLAVQPDNKPAADHLWQIATFWFDTLHGRQITLRPFEESDAPFLHECFRNPHFMSDYHRYLDSGSGSAGMAARLRNAAKSLPAERRSMDWVIFRPGKSAHPIGIVNLVEIESVHRRAEFLIGIPAEAERASGTALEASLLALDFAFNHAGLHKLTTLVYEDNARSQKSTLALGFQQEGYRPEHLFTPQKGCWFGVIENGFTQAAFRANTRLARLSLRLLGRDVTRAGR